MNIKTVLVLPMLLSLSLSGYVNVIDKKLNVSNFIDIDKEDSDIRQKYYYSYINSKANFTAMRLMEEQFERAKFEKSVKPYCCQCDSTTQFDEEYYTPKVHKTLMFIDSGTMSVVVYQDGDNYYRALISGDKNTVPIRITKEEAEQLITKPEI